MSAPLSLITPELALQIVLRHAPTLGTETIALDAALHRTLAHDISAPFNLPPFDNSAMDGYALRCSDLSNSPTLILDGVNAAGGENSRKVLAGHCVAVMTGAPLPPGADAVVMREETTIEKTIDNTRVHFQAKVKAGQNIRRRGNDIARDQIALQAGVLIRASEWALLAALGQSEVEVAQRPRVAIIVTGEELMPVGQSLCAGQIHDSNSYALRGLLESYGAQIENYRCGDDESELKNLLLEVAKYSDLIVTSGGVSMGDFDPVREVLPRIAQLHFWKLAIKPGKPVMFATLEKAERTVPIFGLPGNPVSVMVAAELLVRPALLQMQNRRAKNRAQVLAAVGSAGRSPSGKTEYVRALVEPVDESWTAKISGEQGSARLTTMTRANALLVIGPETQNYGAGDKFPALMLDWPER